jgi:N-acetylglutamate synthase/N-acetylornithine aminotransferase
MSREEEEEEEEEDVKALDEEIHCECEQLCHNSLASDGEGPG